MSKLKFDSKGNLIPYDSINTDWLSFVDVFGWNDYRRSLINSLSLFITELNNLSLTTFTLWVDGSFVTKKENPNDLDVVFIIPSIAYRQFEKDLRLLRNQFDGLDIYFVRMIDEMERDHFLYVSDRAEWLFQFTHTRPDRITRQKQFKGFLQIIWTDESSF